MRWFTPSEWRCHCSSPDCTAPLDLDPVMQARLDLLRSQYGKPLLLTSGLRCATWNRTIGGAVNSAHLIGRAVDLAVMDPIARRLLVALATAFPLVEVCPRHLHLDVTPRPEPLLILGPG